MKLSKILLIGANLDFIGNFTFVHADCTTTPEGYVACVDGGGTMTLTPPDGSAVATIYAPAAQDLINAYNANSTATVAAVADAFSNVGNGAALSSEANYYMNNNTSSNGLDLTTNAGPYALTNGGTYATFQVNGSNSQGGSFPPPPPCYQDYVRYSTGPWSACMISGPWSSSGEASCVQTRSVSSYSTSLACGTSSNDTMPASTQNRTLSIDFMNPTNTCGTGYANGVDTCTISFAVKGPAEWITGINGLGFKNASFSESTPVNQINSTGENGLSLPDTGVIAGNAISFNLSSVVPFSKIGRIGFELQGGGTPASYTPITSTPANIPVSFQKPFIGNLSVVDNDGLLIGTEQTAKVDITHPWFISSLPTYNISHFSDSLNPLDSNYLIQGKNNENNLQGNPTVNFTLNYKGTSQIGDKGIQTSPYITYNLLGKTIAYQLSSTSEPTNNNPLELSNALFLGVRVVGQLQGQGKQTITGQIKNFSDISLFDVRSTVKKNATALIRGMKSGDTVNGVHYIEGDITISGEQPYELLVVQNGNVVISSNTNTLWKKFGIVVMRDDQSRTNLGNIYVKNGVTKMQAFIYADGGFMSADMSGAPYVSNTTTRTNALKQQLILKGILLTRNTIGGAIGDAGTYLLPGGSKTNDIDKAIMYDLNYIRRGYIGWDKNGNGILDAGEYKDPFVIIYDDIIKNSSPKIFSVQ